MKLKYALMKYDYINRLVLAKRLVLKVTILKLSPNFTNYIENI